VIGTKHAIHHRIGYMFQTQTIAENSFSNISVPSEAYNATCEQHVPLDTFLFLEDE
jgi:hypothetical protein